MRVQLGVGGEGGGGSWVWEGGEDEGAVGCGREGRGRGAVGCGREGRCGSAVMTVVPLTGQTALLPTSTHL